MKNLYVLLNQKEEDLRQLQAEIEALRTTLRLIGERALPCGDAGPLLSPNSESIPSSASQALRLAGYISKSISLG